MPRFLMKAAPDRDAYIEWSTIVDAPVGIGDRAHYVTQFHEERLARTDTNGTSARWFDWLPGDQQQGGWADESLIVYNQVDRPGLIPGAKLSDLYDLLATDINATIPAEWVERFEDEADD